jgi:hypothetical protein
LIKSSLIIILCFFWISEGISQKKKDIKTIEIKTEDFQNLSPGNQITIGAKTITHGGKEKSTKTVFDGKLGWNKLNVTVTGGSFSNGIITVEQDLLKVRDHLVMVVVSDAKTKKVSVTKTFKIDFKAPQVCMINGKVGNEGKEGADGANGKKTDDGNGLAGEEGLLGEWGGSGQSSIINIKGVAVGTDTLLKIQVEDLIDKTKKRFMVNVNGGSIVIDASGGAGGRGGKGGDGGDGKDQGEGQSSPGTGGDAGNGGTGGNGGSGGALLVYYDLIAAKHMDKIEFKVNGGAAGQGGKRGKRGQGGKDPNDDRSTAGKVLFGSGKSRGEKGSYGEDGQPGEDGEVSLFEEEFVEVDF